MKHPRSAFSRLASVYERTMLRPSSDWMETLRSVGEAFADPSEAVLLKEWLLTPRDLPEHEELQRSFATTSFLLNADNAKPVRGRIARLFKARAGPLASLERAGFFRCWRSWSVSKSNRLPLLLLQLWPALLSPAI